MNSARRHSPFAVAALEIWIDGSATLADELYQQEDRSYGQGKQHDECGPHERDVSQQNRWYDGGYYAVEAGGPDPCTTADVAASLLGCLCHSPGTIANRLALVKRTGKK